MEEGLQDGLHHPEVGGQGGGDDQAEEEEDGPVLGQAGGGRGVGGGGAGTFPAQPEEKLQAACEERPQEDRQSHYDCPEDETSAVLLILPDITGRHVLLPDDSETFNLQSDCS